MSKVWFITGGGRGMGTDIAKAALDAGYFLSFQPVSQAYDIALRRRAEEFLVVAAEV